MKTLPVQSVSPARSVPSIRLLVLLSLAVGLDRAPRTAAESAPPRQPLAEVGVTAELARGVIHEREVDLAAGDFLHVIVEQDGVDLSLRLIAPDGSMWQEFDGPSGATGPEELAVIVPTAGRYRVEVETSSKTGHYRTTLWELRIPGGGEHELVATVNKEARAFRFLLDGFYEKSTSILEQTLKIWQRRELHWRQALTLYSLCFAYRESGHFEEAYPACEESAEWFRVLDAPVLLAGALYSTGNLDVKRFDTVRARRRLEEAAQLDAALGNPLASNLTLTRLAELDAQAGDLSRSVKSFEDALRQARDHGDLGTEALVRIQLASNLIALHQPNDARQHFRRAAEIYHRLGDIENNAIALRGIADASLRLGELLTAERDARSALRILPLSNRLQRAASLETISEVYQARGLFTKAHRALSNALVLATANEPILAQTRASILTSLGDLLRKTRAPKEALAAHREAHTLFLDIGNLIQAASSLARQAEALRDLGRLEEAQAHIEKALAQVEELHRKTGRGDLRQSYYAYRQEYYDLAIDILVRLHAKQPTRGYAREALAVHDRRLARALNERRTLRGSDAIQAAASSASAKEQLLELTLRELAASPTSPARRTRSAQLIRELQRTRDEIRSSRGLPPPNALPPLEIAALQDNLLDDDSLVLVYNIGEAGSSYLWVLDAETFEVHRLRPRAEIAPRVRELLAAIGPYSRTTAELPSRGGALSEMLLAPVAGHLGNRRLVLVVDDILMELPFAALPSPSGTDTGDSTLDRLLIERHEIVMVPSLSSLATRHSRLQGTRPSREIAIVVDPVYRAPRPSLPATAKEATAILRHLKARSDTRHLTLARGADASRTRALEILERPLDLLHIAAHVELDPHHPELSTLVLSDLGPDKEADTYLRSFEIVRRQLDIDLVVLSTCHSGAGMRLRGEGPLGLSRSFLIAGAKRVIASLWQVDDQWTSQLMSSFYAAHLRDGLPPSAALRHAQLEMFRSGLPTSAWAGFVIQGDWQPTA